MTEGKIIVLSAPSGSGKSTIINQIKDDPQLVLQFSVSATNRKPREGEEDGVDYNFMSTEEFQDHIANGDFVEHEEVYPGRFYGTLRSEIERIVRAGANCLLDIDVEGALNVKRIFGDRALTLYICPPDVATLRERLIGRGTDSMEEIERRVAKADKEMARAQNLDSKVVNDDLKTAVEQVRSIICNFIGA